MGEIINLRRARKAKKRETAAAIAAANRLAFGRTKGERAGAEAERAWHDQIVRGAKLDKDDGN